MTTIATEVFGGRTLSTTVADERAVFGPANITYRRRRCSEKGTNMPRAMGWLLFWFGALCWLFAGLLLTSDLRPKIGLGTLGSCLVAAGVVQLMGNDPPVGR